MLPARVHGCRLTWQEPASLRVRASLEACKVTGWQIEHICCFSVYACPDSWPSPASINENQWNCPQLRHVIAALPTLDIAEGALNRIFTIYKQQLAAGSDYLTKAGTLNPAPFEALLKTLAGDELETLEQRASVSWTPALCLLSVREFCRQNGLRRNAQALKQSPFHDSFDIPPVGFPLLLALGFLNLRPTYTCNDVMPLCLPLQAQ